MVTELIKQEGSYLQAFADLHASQSKSRVEWLQRLRTNAWERFAELGFPSVKDEEWKYTNVAPIARMSLEASSANASLEAPGFGVPEASESQLVFVNGKLQVETSSVAALGDGVVGVNLAEAIAGSE